MRALTWSLLLWAVGLPTPVRGEAPLREDQEGAEARGAAETETFGPRAGRFGIRAVLLGNSLTPSANLVPALGARLFVTDTLVVGARAGVGLVWGNEATQTGYELGLGLGLYRGGSRGRLHPFLDAEATLIHTTTAQATRTILLLSAGAGLEHWLAEMVSTSVVLKVGFAKNFTDGTLALGTVNPGLIVTLYTN